MPKRTDIHSILIIGAGPIGLAVAAHLVAVPAAQGGIFTVMLPVSAAAVGVLFLGEHMGGMQAVALLIALAGVVLATLPARPARRSAA